MVKGIQRQVIVVQSPDPKLFEQAIFILRDGQKALSDEALLKEAQRLIGRRHQVRPGKWLVSGAVWAVTGGLVSSILWSFFMFL